MPLEQLVEYFNGRFGQEHHPSFHPLILEEKKITGLFGPIRIDSVFAPLRQTLKPTVIIGHTAQMAVATYKPQHLHANEIDALLVNNNLAQAPDFESIINFDRLSRTVHMLNYLSLSHVQGLLFLAVDPLHILGIKQDHGAYFQEMIVKCGLDIKNVVMVSAVNSHYIRYYQQLINGLGNYRRRGYQIAIKFDDDVQEE